MLYMGLDRHDVIWAWTDVMLYMGPDRLDVIYGPGQT